MTSPPAPLPAPMVLVPDRLPELDMEPIPGMLEQAASKLTMLPAKMSLNIAVNFLVRLKSGGIGSAWRGTLD